MNKPTCYVHTVEYYTALQRKDILTRASTWVTREDILLSERLHSQKDKLCRLHLYQVARTVKFTESEIEW